MGIRYQDVQMLGNSLDGYREAVLREKMRMQQEEQRAIDNQLRQEMHNYQKQRDLAADSRDERNFGYQVGRDRMGDAYRFGRDRVADRRWDSEFNYRKGRDTVADERDTRDFGFRVMGEQRNDFLRNMELALRAQAIRAQTDRASRGTVEEEIDPTTGNVMRAVRRTPVAAPMRSLRGPTDDEAPTAKPPAGAKMPPPEAIDYLRKNATKPGVLQAFQSKYGVDPATFLN